MKVAALVFNIGLLLFTFVVHITDGLPKEIGYIILSVWTILTPILTIGVISRDRYHKKIIEGTIICNIVLVGFICWAFVDQYPHPEESGYIEYVVLMVMTPL